MSNRVSGGADLEVSQRGRGNYETLTSAKNAAKSGDVIVVLDGTYNENDLWKGGVTWHFCPGSGIDYTDPGTGTIRGLFDDQSDPGTTCQVTGFGTFRHILSGFPTLGLGSFRLTNASSRLHLQGRRLEIGGGGAIEQAGISVQNGTCFVKLDELVDLSGAATAVGGIFFQAGYADIEIDYMSVFGYCLHAKEAAGTPTASLFYRGKSWTQLTDSIVAAAIDVEPNATGTPNPNFLVAGRLQRLSSYNGNTLAYVGRFYLDVDESISTFGNVLHEFNYGCDVYLTAKKCINQSTSNSFLLWAMPNHTGKAVLRVEDWRQDASTAPVVVLAGTGTVMMAGQFMRAANGKGIDVTGAGTWRVKGYRIDTTPTNNAANHAVNLGNSATGLVLEQCILLAPALAKSVEAGVARTITAYGTKANKAKNANVTVNVDTFGAADDANVV